MAHSKYPRIVPMSYDPKFDLETKGPIEIARRAVGEIRGLAHDFNLIENRLSNDLRCRYLDDVAGRLAFDYEDYLHRVHCVRERSWDVLTGISTRGKEILRDCDPHRLGTPRKPKDRELIGTEVRSIHPTLFDSFTRLQNEIANDVGMRNIATHQTFVWLALMPNEDDAREINDYDFPADGCEAERAARKVVRKLLREFVAEQRLAIKTLMEVTKLFIDAAETAYP